MLKMIGCLDKNDNLTKLGQFLLKIPIQPFLARAIVEGLLIEKLVSLNPSLNIEESGFALSIIQILCLVLNANNLFRIP